MELVALQVDVAGKDVVQDHVLDEIAPVVLFVVILLDAAQGNRQDLDKLLGFGVLARHKDGVFRTGTAAKGTEAVLLVLEHLGGDHILRAEALADLADLAQLAAGNDHRGLVPPRRWSVDGVPHLMDDTLKQSV